MPIQNGKYVNPNWVNDTAPAMNATEMNAISDTLEKVPPENGGTGQTSLSATRNAMGLGTNAVPITSGGTGATSAQDARTNLGFNGTGGIVPVTLGGTGKTAFASNGVLLGWADQPLKVVPSVRGAFYSTGNGAQPQFNTLPVAMGGTGVESLSQLKTNLGFSNGVLPISAGGTGTASVTAYTDNTNGLTAYKWGKLVMVYCSVKTALSDGYLPASLPSGYRPSQNLHIICPIYKTSAANAQNMMDGYAIIIVYSNGSIYTWNYSPKSSDSVNACPRFEAMFMTT